MDIEISKMIRKSRDQRKILKRSFEESRGNWTREQQQELAAVLGLTEQQVYKWSWDQKKRLRRDLQLIQENNKNEDTVEGLASLLGLDIEAKARQLICEAQEDSARSLILNLQSKSCLETLKPVQEPKVKEAGTRRRSVRDDLTIDVPKASELLQD